MTTYVELNKDGTRTVFHRKGLKAWSHPEKAPHMIENGEVKPCPECDRSYKP